MHMHDRACLRVVCHQHTLLRDFKSPYILHKYPPAFRSVTMGPRVRGHEWSACMAGYPNISVVRMAVAIQVSKVDIANVILVQPAAKMPGLKSPLCVPFLSLNWEIERFTVPLSTLISWRYGRLQTVSGDAKLCWA